MVEKKILLRDNHKRLPPHMEAFPKQRETRNKVEPATHSHIQTLAEGKDRNISGISPMFSASTSLR